MTPLFLDKEKAISFLLIRINFADHV